jgi:hypothetical protein
MIITSGMQIILKESYTPKRKINTTIKVQEGVNPTRILHKQVSIRKDSNIRKTT